MCRSKDWWRTGDNLVVATLICVPESSILYFHIQRFCAKSCTGESDGAGLGQTAQKCLPFSFGIISSNVAGRETSLNIGSYLPSMVLWTWHKTLEMTDFNHALRSEKVFLWIFDNVLTFKCNLYVFPPIKCAFFRSLLCMFLRRAKALTF